MKSSLRWFAVVCLAIALVASVAAHAQTEIATTLVAGPAIANVDTLTITLTMNAMLTETESGAPVAGKKVDFFVGSSTREICTGVTNVNGQASCGGILGAVNATLNLGYRALFVGDGFFATSSDRGPIVRVAGTDVLP